MEHNHFIELFSMQNSASVDLGSICVQPILLFSVWSHDMEKNFGNSGC